MNTLALIALIAVFVPVALYLIDHICGLIIEDHVTRALGPAPTATTLALQGVVGDSVEGPSDVDLAA